MRVMHLINTLEMGGAQSVLLQLAKAWPAAADEHLVVSLLPGKSMGAAFAQAGVRVEYVGRQPWRLLRLALVYKPDLLQTWLYHSDLAGSLLGAMLGVPVVWGVHHTTADAGSVKASTLRVVRWLARLAPLRWPGPRAIVCCSHSALQSHLALGYPGQKCRLIENGVELRDGPGRATSRPALAAELAMPAGAYWVGMFARFNPQKDHQNFIAAAKILADRLELQGKQAYFVLAGPQMDAANPHLAEWIRQAGLGEVFRLLGTRQDVDALIAAMDVVTLSSAYGEALPMVLCEAMAQGALCAATDVGDTRALLGDAGWVVPPRDPAALADAWQKICQMPAGQREGMALKARQRVQEGYGSAAMASKYHQLYSEVLAGK